MVVERISLTSGGNQCQSENPESRTPLPVLHSLVYSWSGPLGITLELSCDAKRRLLQRLVRFAVSKT